MTAARRACVCAAALVALAASPSGQGVPPGGAPFVQASAAADAAVRETLQRYAAALKSRDVEAVKKVHPSVPAESLAKAFRDMRDLDVVIDEVRVLSMDGTTARVSCKVLQTLEPRVGSKRTTSVTRVLRLRRAAEAWVIDSFER